MRFLGSIQGHTILILVDSGSSHTFINASVAAQLARISSLDHYLIV
jgi:predicted aspartyl protease